MAKRKAKSENGTGRTVHTNEEFVTAWIEGTTIAEVAAALGVTYGAVASRKAKLLASGVKLPAKERAVPARRIVDVKALNALISAAK